MAKVTFSDCAMSWTSGAAASGEINMAGVKTIKSVLWQDCVKPKYKTVK